MRWESIHIYEQYNVQDSYRNKSELAKSIQAEKRSGMQYKLCLYLIQLFIFNYLHFKIILEKKRKGKLTSSVTKKQRNNSQNKENSKVIIELDNDDPLLDQQKKIIDLAQEKLHLQKQTNDELEREIMLLEK